VSGTGGFAIREARAKRAFPSAHDDVQSRTGELGLATEGIESEEKRTEEFAELISFLKENVRPGTLGTGIPFERREWSTKSMLRTISESVVGPRSYDFHSIFECIRTSTNRIRVTRVLKSSGR
jgi:hypothetical protein